MKMVGRTIAILAAALLVVAATMAVARSDYGQRMLAAGRGGERFEREGFPMGGEGPPPFMRPGREGMPGGAFEHGGEFERHGRGGGASLFGLATVAKNFVTMAVIIAIVVAVTAALRRGGSRRPGLRS